MAATDLRQLGDLLESCRDVVVVVDDAHHLDPLSGSLLAHLVDDGRARVVATSKFGRVDQAESLALLIGLGLDIRVLEPFTGEQSRELFLALAPGASDAGSAVAHRRSGGRPALVAALASNGPRFQTSLLIESWLAAAGGEAPAAARFLAVAGSLPAGLAVRVAGADAVVRLERARLASSTRVRRRLNIELDPPMLRDVLWDSLGEAERQITVRELAAAFDSLPQRRVTDARLAIELADRGGPRPPDELLDMAVQHAVERGDGELAARIAAVVEAEQQDVAGDGEPEVSGFEGRAGPGVEHAGLEELKLIQTEEEALLSGSPDQLASKARVLLGQRENSDRVRLLAETVLLDHGSDQMRVAEVVAEIAANTAWAGDDSPVPSALSPLLYYSRVLAGQLSATDSITTSAVSSKGLGRGLLTRVRLDLGRCVANSLGEPSTPLALDGPGAPIPASVLIEGLDASACGDLGRASELLREAGDGGGDAPEWLRQVTRALAATLAGELGLETRHLLAGSATGRRAGWLRTDGIWVVAETWALNRFQPDMARVAHVTEARVNRLLDTTGEVAWALLALLVICRFDRVAGLETLISDVGSQVDGPVASQLVSVAPALAAQDVGDIARSAGLFAELGFRPLAAEFFHAAAAREALAGQEVQSQRYCLYRDALLRRCQSPVLGRVQPVFSTREAEIVTLLAGATTNRDLARTLFLSRRTVENHLARIYRRLGLCGRSELLALRDDAGWPAGESHEDQVDAIGRI